ncbi:hypothetical protein EBF03_05700 [Arcanobacterium haemolyticum]|uniref:Dinitrogenase iron-molybdenum cofactor biosynthesis domain-containing protein n=2 Tax=Arcanobacterium haemolyticum TaxID=28264 RepID=D7BPL9_ARCHD|nr:hypothetical protein Arch_1155 [Arcanobacterium haemolyticum DSM 20595]QCX46954.1 hypothetical protein EBF03_05700 [Arcanobacterium haemolyticum]SQH28383.1 Dinitrogenase iron-molybdenum cofactor [Arcanobacterium haemolyticum]
MRGMIRQNDIHVAVNVRGDHVGGGLGKAHTMAVATVADGAILSWEEIHVGWDLLHGQGPEGTHHGRIVRFMREHAISVVVTGHLGLPMRNTLGKLGVRVVTSDGIAKTVALEACNVSA